MNSASVTDEGGLEKVRLPSILIAGGDGSDGEDSAAAVGGGGPLGRIHEVVVQTQKPRRRNVWRK
jgi:hypothetical protein